MATIEIINTGLTIRGQVRVRGEILELPSALTVKEQRARSKKGKIWYAIVGTEDYERKEFYYNEIMKMKKDPLAMHQTISPDWSDGQLKTNTELDIDEGFENPNTGLIKITDEAPVKLPSEIVTEDVEEQVKVTTSDTLVDTTYESIKRMSKKNLINFIASENLEVKFNDKTKAAALRTRIIKVLNLQKEE